MIGHNVAALFLVFFVAWRGTSRLLPEREAPSKPLPARSAERAPQRPKRPQKKTSSAKSPAAGRGQSSVAAAPALGACAKAEPAVRAPARELDVSAHEQTVVLRFAICQHPPAIARLAKLFGGKQEIHKNLLEEIQKVPITADLLGVCTTERILNELPDARSAASCATRSGVAMHSRTGLGDSRCRRQPTPRPMASRR